MIPALPIHMSMMKWSLLGLLVASFALDHWPRHSASADLASISSPLTEFSDFDELIVNWSRIAPTSRESHQSHWLDIIEAAHCDGVPDREMIWLEGSHAYNWEPTQNIVIPPYSHSYETRLSGRLINEAALALSAQMQVHGCKAEDVQLELQIIPKFKSASSVDEITTEPEKIEINRSSNVNLQTGNSHAFENGLGLWTLSRGS